MYLDGEKGGAGGMSAGDSAWSFWCPHHPPKEVTSCAELSVSLLHSSSPRVLRHPRMPRSPLRGPISPRGRVRQPRVMGAMQPKQPTRGTVARLTTRTRVVPAGERTRDTASSRTDKKVPHAGGPVLTGPPALRPGPVRSPVVNRSGSRPSRRHGSARSSRGSARPPRSPRCAL